MCGRFTITWEAKELQEELNLGEFPIDWQPHFNVTPNQMVAVVRDFETRKVERLQWGLIPSWAQDATISSRLINARSETLGEKPSFRRALAKRRCLILADGFFEWQKFPDKKVSSKPYYFYLKNKKPFFLAGLWEFWQPAGGEPVESCTIITCPANEVVAPIHERMPVLFTVESCWDWLMFSQLSELQSLLKPYPASLMTAHPVSRQVNDPDCDKPEIIKALA